MVKTFLVGFMIAMGVWYVASGVWQLIASFTSTRLSSDLEPRKDDDGPASDDDPDDDDPGDKTEEPPKEPLKAIARAAGR